MSCKSVRRIMMEAERLEPPPAEVRPHLADCADCRAWLRNLSQVERQLPLLPVPATQGKEKLLLRLSELKPSRRSDGIIPLPAQIKERALRKVALACALAATVAAFAVGLWLWPKGMPTQMQSGKADPVMAWKAQHDQRLGKARTPRERVQVLVDFAGSLQEEAARLVRTEDDERLEALAQYFSDTLPDELVATAQSVPADERAEVVKEARSRLRDTESALERLASQSEEAAVPLRRIASAVRDADRRLREAI